MSSEIKTAVPKLRFPEFRDAVAWEKIPLENALNPVVREVEKPSIIYTGLGVRSHGKGTFLKKNEDPKKNSMSCLYEVKPDDLIVNITFAWEGAIAIAKESDDGSLVSHRFPTYVFDQEIALPSFFQYIILNKRFVYNLGVISPGGAGRNRVLSKKDFLKLVNYLPSIPEQQKIADCLTSLDEVISAEGQKLEALRDHKKGLMQNLFPAEGQTLPKFRFPEFRDAGEWESEEFGEMYSFKGTNSLSREKLTLSGGTVRNIHYGDIHTKFSSQFSIGNEEVPYIVSSESLAKIKSDNYCKIRDLIFADASEDIDDIGKCIEIVELSGEKLLSGLHTILARQKGARLITGFAGHLFQSTRLRRQIQNEAQGAKVLGISKGRLTSIEVCFPEDEEEQQKIADCLSSLDELISAQSQKIEALREHKKGLLQQLFPSAEEVA